MSTVNTEADQRRSILRSDVERARYDRGMQVLSAVDGEGGQRVVDALADIAPALAHHVVAYGFGEVYARPGLTPPQPGSTESHS